MVQNLGDRQFDGIICLGGEDWWYHNRGHFDFQIMRRLAKRWPVLFVNSLGVRMPSVKDGPVFAERIGRKLKSFSRGVREVEPGFFVYSPVSVPGSAGRRLSNWALAPQITWAASRAGIRKPLLWVHCPAGAEVIDKINHAGLIMQRTDRFEAFPEGDARVLTRQIGKLQSRADLAVYCAPHLAREEQSKVARQLIVTHGVDAEDFLAAGKNTCNEPGDVAHIARPRIGFIGGIDAHTFDPALFNDVVAQLPQAQFVLIGACSLPDGWSPHANVHLLGRRPYDSIASYMAAMDVLIMPWNQSEWIKACNPVKLKEYLAVGRPVVTIDFDALGPWRDCVRVADCGASFASGIVEALKQPHDPTAIEPRIHAETWEHKAQALVETLFSIGFRHVSQSSRHVPEAAAHQAG